LFADVRDDFKQEIYRRKTVVPTLSLAGGSDGALDSAIYAQMPVAFAGSYKGIMIPEAGHFLHRNNPRGLHKNCFSFWLSREHCAAAVEHRWFVTRFCFASERSLPSSSVSAKFLLAAEKARRDLESGGAKLRIRNRMTNRRVNFGFGLLRGSIERAAKLAIAVNETNRRPPISCVFSFTTAALRDESRHRLS